MSTLQELAHKIQQLEALNRNYPPDAYSFLLWALDDTIRKLPKSRHVSGQELTDGIRKYALDQFGPMARTVFDHWRIRSTLDFGRMVFDLIDLGILRKTETDTLDDFKDRYDFEEAFNGKCDFQDVKVK